MISDGQVNPGTHIRGAVAADPAITRLAPTEDVPGPTLSKKRTRQERSDLQDHLASASENSAITALSPNRGMPGSPPIRVRVRQAHSVSHGSQANTTEPASAALPTDADMPAPTLSADHIGCGTHTTSVGSSGPVQGVVATHLENDGSAPFHEECLWLMEQEAQRKAFIKSANRLKSASGAYVRRCLGWSPDLPEAEARALNARAAALVTAIEMGGAKASLVAEYGETVAICYGFVRTNLLARRPIDASRATLEKDMAATIERMPVWTEWAARLHGLTSLGLAVILGETGNLSNYDTPSKVWKRCGLAVADDGRRQRRIADAELALAMGYSPQRRSQVWNYANEALWRQQYQRTGYYYVTYRDKKDAYTPRVAVTERLDSKDPLKWTPMRVEKAARRYAEKRFILHLWQAWHALTHGSNHTAFRQGLSLDNRPHWRG